MIAHNNMILAEWSVVTISCTKKTDEKETLYNRSKRIISKTYCSNTHQDSCGLSS